MRPFRLSGSLTASESNGVSIVFYLLTLRRCAARRRRRRRRQLPYCGCDDNTEHWPSISTEFELATAIVRSRGSQVSDINLEIRDEISHSGCVRFTDPKNAFNFCGIVTGEKISDQKDGFSLISEVDISSISGPISVSFLLISSFFDELADANERTGLNGPVFEISDNRDFRFRDLRKSSSFTANIDPIQNFRDLRESWLPSEHFALIKISLRPLKREILAFKVRVDIWISRLQYSIFLSL